MDLLNQYPGLSKNDEISFSTLGEDKGKAIFVSSGPAVEQERKSITGVVHQRCAYPFQLVYRASGLSESRKANVKEWMDNLGRWLEKQTVTINGTAYTLEDYPPLTGSRKFTEFRRTSPAYLAGVEENKAENWVISITARYENTFKRKD